MAELCICCNKKIGLIHGSHLNNKLCDNCYFPIRGYLTDIENESDLAAIQNIYSELTSKIHELTYSEIGKQYIINYANSIIKQKADANANIIDKQIKLDNFKITTSNNFEGYMIKEYKGVVSGDTILGTGLISESDLAKSNWFGYESHEMSGKLNQARKTALNRAIETAIDMKCNSIIGTKFNYLTLSSNTIVVVVDGTAVIIENNDNIK